MGDMLSHHIHIMYRLVITRANCVSHHVTCSGRTGEQGPRMCELYRRQVIEGGVLGTSLALSGFITEGLIHTVLTHCRIRTKWFDQAVNDATITRGIRQVVIVAAGFDTRAYR